MLARGPGRLRRSVPLDLSAPGGSREHLCPLTHDHEEHA
jgi:hypothetical protein